MRGRVGRIGDRWDNPFVSRDYAEFNPPCDVQYCPCNKKGKCELPSQIKINADGRCSKSIDFKPKGK